MLANRSSGRSSNHSSTFHYIGPLDLRWDGMETLNKVKPIKLAVGSTRVSVSDFWRILDNEAKMTQSAARVRRARDDAEAIFRFALQAVDGRRVVREQLQWDGRWLCCGDEEWDLQDCRRIVVVGGGKAVHAMQQGLLEAFRESQKPFPSISGWLNVPQGIDHDRSATAIRLHAARPAGRNEPTEEGVFGCRQMMEMVRQCEPTISSLHCSREVVRR